MRANSVTAFLQRRHITTPLPAPESQNEREWFAQIREIRDKAWRVVTSIDDADMADAVEVEHQISTLLGQILTYRENKEALPDEDFIAGQISMMRDAGARAEYAKVRAKYESRIDALEALRSRRNEMQAQLESVAADISINLSNLSMTVGTNSIDVSNFNVQETEELTDDIYALRYSMKKLDEVSEEEVTGMKTGLAMEV